MRKAEDLALGTIVGMTERDKLGEVLGTSVGTSEGRSLGSKLGTSVSMEEGTAVGVFVGITLEIPENDVLLTAVLTAEGILECIDNGIPVGVTDDSIVCTNDGFELSNLMGINVGLKLGILEGIVEGTLVR